MITVGVTGSIGMGKSTAARMLRALKIPVHCSDEAVHELLGPHGAGVAAVEAAFPGSRDRKSGATDRAALLRSLGRDHAQWDRLERVLHPLVRERQQRFLRAQRVSGAALVALDIPLLFETGAETRLDYTICVTAPRFLQKMRLRARASFQPQDLDFRLARQLPDREKRRRADFVVQTGLGRAHTFRALRRIVRQLKARSS
jgi:dephospho-CoA kinase